MSPVCKIVPIYPLKRIITDPGQWLASINVISTGKYPPLYIKYKLLVYINDCWCININANDIFCSWKHI